MNLESYMEEQKEIKEMNQTQQSRWLVNNIIICYERETHMGNDSERKQHFLQHKGKHSNNKEAYTDEIKEHRMEIRLCSRIRRHH